MEGENEDPATTICAAIKKTQTLMTERKKKLETSQVTYEGGGGGGWSEKEALNVEHVPKEGMRDDLMNVPSSSLTSHRTHVPGESHMKPEKKREAPVRRPSLRRLPRTRTHPPFLKRIHVGGKTGTSFYFIPR